MTNQAMWFLVLGSLSLLSLATANSVTVSGERRIWHKVTLSLTGPEADEVSSTFRNYALSVSFSQGSRNFVVPGYFAADGNAAETSATAGNIWRVHFSPDSTGQWSWTVSFKQGSNIAIDGGGAPIDGLHGLSGQFQIADTDKTGRDHRGKGRLDYVGKHHLQFAGSKEFFLKFGADSPENFLAYEDFDNTGNIGGRLKSYAAHLNDYQNDGDVWQGGKGKELFGLLNYHASKGNNVQSFLTMNIQGDGQNVFMYVSDSKRDTFDVSKCDQWERIFEHMDRKGLYLHFKTQETENDNDVLNLETRTLYYRELVARFSHHLALNWNIGEENSNTVEERRVFSNLMRNLDPYNHHIVIHTFPMQQELVYGQLLETHEQNSYTGASVQSSPFENVHEDILRWITRSQEVGHPWVVASDEVGPAVKGIFVDGDEADANHDIQRAEVIYGAIMAGGAGIEAYTGSSPVSGDLRLQDMRLYDQWWDQCRYAREFFSKHSVPFQEMMNADNLVDDGWLLKGDELYVVYMKQSSGAVINLSGEKAKTEFTVRWYSPSEGGDLLVGGLSCIESGPAVSIGTPPSAGGPDWLAHISLGCDESASDPSAEDSCYTPDNNNRVVIPAESASVAGTLWEKLSMDNRGYIEWTGENRYGGAESDGDLTYSFTCTAATQMKILLMSSRPSGGRNDENNDAWISINGANFIKLFTPFGETFDEWRYSDRFDEGNTKTQPVFNCQAGLNELIISGRSSSFRIDYIVIAPTSTDRTTLNIELATTPKGSCEAETTEPVETDGPIVDATPSPVQTETPTTNATPSPAQTVETETPTADATPSPAQTVEAETPTADVTPSPAQTVETETPIVDTTPSPAQTVETETPIVDTTPSPVQTEAPIVDVTPSPVPIPTETEGPVATEDPVDPIQTPLPTATAEVETTQRKCFGPPRPTAENPIEASTVIVQPEVYTGDFEGWFLRSSNENVPRVYIEWTGPNQMSRSDVESDPRGVLNYDFTVPQSATYYIYFWSSRLFGEAGVNNDAWLAVDGGRPEKVFTRLPNASIGDPKTWRMSYRIDLDNGDKIKPAFELTKGRHQLTIIGRSRHFEIDSVVIVPRDREAGLPDPTYIQEMRRKESAMVDC